MAATDDTALPTSRDWIRFLLQDTDTTRPMLQDEEIDAVLTATLANITHTEAARYFAAATILSSLHTAWMSRGRGLSSKKVSQLSVVYGSGAGINIDAAIQARIKELRLHGAHLLCPVPRSLALI